MVQKKVERKKRAGYGSKPKNDIKLARIIDDSYDTFENRIKKEVEIKSRILQNM